MADYDESPAAKLPTAEEERALFAEREKCLKDHIRDLERAYAIAMDLVKAAPRETLATVGATCRLAMQDEQPNTRDLITAILQRAGSV